MRWILLFFIIPFVSSCQENADVILRNGKIIDGTGNPWYYGDIAIKNGKIVAIGKPDMTAKREIDITGLVVSPGFIDVHTHIEGDEVENPLASNFIYDGVTSVVTGNCGSSRPNLKQYFNTLDSLKLSVNVASLIGHNTVRKAIMGSANRAPTPAELRGMDSLVEVAMKHGATGLSTGLIYIPGTYAKTDEIVVLAKAAAKYQGVYASHMRDEGDSVMEAISEAITIGRLANMPVEISHFKVSGHQNWGKSKQTVAMIEAARKEGLEVTIDQYPYTASSTSLSTLLPEWVLADGQDSIVSRLANEGTRKAVITGMVKKLKKRGLKHFDYAMVAYYRYDTTLNGKSIETINTLKGRKHNAANEAETILEMMEKGGAGMVFHGMSEDDVKYIMQYPHNMFASDASIRIFNQGAPHPRGYGTNARVLAKYVRDERVLTLEDAIRRMTSLPAQKFRLKSRGLLKEGYAADIVVFDEKTVRDLSTFDKPHQYSAGFHYVLVNGVLTVDKGIHNGQRAGKNNVRAWCYFVAEAIFNQWVISTTKKEFTLQKPNYD